MSIELVLFSFVFLCFCVFAFALVFIVKTLKTIKQIKSLKEDICILQQERRELSYRATKLNEDIVCQQDGVEFINKINNLKRADK